MKIVILDGQALNPGDLSWESVTSLGETIIYDQTVTPEQAIERIGDAQIVITNKTIITKGILDACPNIKLICVSATGYNNVDGAAARKRNIPVCNVPGYGTTAVAQFTIALLLELCHRIGYHSDLVHEGEWEKCPNFCFWRTTQTELTGKTFGIIGYGSIGRAVAPIAYALGMKVLATSRSRREDPTGIAEIVDLDTLLANSDIISLHCPLFPETEGIICGETISKMKDGVMILNTARGPLIDEKALYDALCSGKVKGAAVDVVSREPILGTNPLLSAPNCIITPHMAWSQTAARQRVVDITADNIIAFLKGFGQNVVN